MYNYKDFLNIEDDFISIKNSFNHIENKKQININKSILSKNIDEIDNLLKKLKTDFKGLTKEYNDKLERTKKRKKYERIK